MGTEAQTEAALLTFHADENSLKDFQKLRKKRPPAPLNETFFVF